MHVIHLLLIDGSRAEIYCDTNDEQLVADYMKLIKKLGVGVETRRFKGDDILCITCQSYENYKS